jgi:hypothetical protein
MTQSFNRNPSRGKGDPAFAVRRLPSLFMCDDLDYATRVKAFVTSAGDDETDKNRTGRNDRRVGDRLGSVKANIEAMYGLAPESGESLQQDDGQRP